MQGGIWTHDLWGKRQEDSLKLVFGVLKFSSLKETVN